MRLRISALSAAYDSLPSVGGDEDSTPTRLALRRMVAAMMGQFERLACKARKKARLLGLVCSAGVEEEAPSITPRHGVRKVDDKAVGNEKRR